MPALFTPGNGPEADHHFRENTKRYPHWVLVQDTQGMQRGKKTTEEEEGFETMEAHDEEVSATSPLYHHEIPRKQDGRTDGTFPEWV